MVFDAARGTLDDLDDLEDEEAAGAEGEEDEAPSSRTPERQPRRPASPIRSGSSGRKVRRQASEHLAPRKSVVLSKTHWEKSQAEREALDKAFKLLDRDGDGSVLPQDIMEASQELGLHFRRADIYQLIGDHDLDGEGRIQEGEFRGIMIEGVRDEDVGDDFDLLWEEFDHNNNGYCDVETLKTIFNDFGEDVTKIDLMKMIREAKQDRDVGTPDEFRVRKDELRSLLEAANTNARVQAGR